MRAHISRFLRISISICKHQSDRSCRCREWEHDLLAQEQRVLWAGFQIFSLPFQCNPTFPLYSQQKEDPCPGFSHWSSLPSEGRHSQVVWNRWFGVQACPSSTSHSPSFHPPTVAIEQYRQEKRTLVRSNRCNTYSLWDGTSSVVERAFGLFISL